MASGLTLAQNGCVHLDHLEVGSLWGEAAEVLATPARREAGRQRSIRQDALQSVGQSDVLSGRYQEGTISVTCCLADRGEIGRHDWRCQRHRFDNCTAETFI